MLRTFILYFIIYIYIEREREVYTHTHTHRVPFYTNTYTMLLWSFTEKHTINCLVLCRYLGPFHKGSFLMASS